MKALVRILFNTDLNSYHPIMYIEAPFPGEDDRSIIRFKSKGHHTAGFESLEDARIECNSIKAKLIEHHMSDVVMVQTETLIDWTGEGIPADIEIMRTENFIKS